MHAKYKLFVFISFASLPKLKDQAAEGIHQRLRSSCCRFRLFFRR